MGDSDSCSMQAIRPPCMAKALHVLGRPPSQPRGLSAAP